MNSDRKLEIIQIVYIQQDKDNYKLVRFNGMEQMRTELKAHGITIGKNVNIGREVLIADGVTVGDDTTVLPEATLEKGAQIGEGCFIGRDAFIGRYTRLHNNVSIGEKTELGRAVIVGDNTELAENCIVQDNVHIGFSSILRPGAYIGNESSVGHHSLIGTEARLGRMVQVAPSTTVDAHRVVNSFMTVSGTAHNLYLDDALRNHYAVKEWPVMVGGEKVQADNRIKQPAAEEQKTRKVFSL